MNVGANGKNLNSIVIPKARKVLKSCFVSVLLRRCLALDDRLCFSSFCLTPGHWKELENKTYPAMNTPVHGEPMQ